jgi:hypothetical protein
MFPSNKQTGGNAIQHYNVLTVELKRMGDSAWKMSKELPSNSFVSKAVIKKSKVSGRYKGNDIQIYFYEGKFDDKFNVIAIGKDLELHDGKSYGEQTYKGVMDMYNRMTPEDVEKLRAELMPAFNKSISTDKKELPEDESD